MKSRYRFLRKSYAMQRMAQAIERAIQGGTSKEKERAARWAAAWGLLCGIRTPAVRLRRGEVADVVEPRGRRASDQIEIPAAAAAEAPPAAARMNQDSAAGLT
jgi:hypothetical protein